jgi:hypothetical protein
MSEADWRYFLDDWDVFQELANIGPNVPRRRLEFWNCMAPELKHMCKDAGIRESTETEQALIQAIKELAVRQNNVLISQVQFMNMGQEREESGLSYSARLRGKSSQCSFTVTCAGCEVDVSYAEKILAHQFVRGLVDPVIQEKILAKASGGQEFSIKELNAMVVAYEMGKRSQALLVGSGGLNRVSDYRAIKDGQKKGSHQGPGPQ